MVIGNRPARHGRAGGFRCSRVRTAGRSVPMEPRQGAAWRNGSVPSSSLGTDFDASSRGSDQRR